MFYAVILSEAHSAQSKDPVLALASALPAHPAAQHPNLFIR